MIGSAYNLLDSSQHSVLSSTQRLFLHQGSLSTRTTAAAPTIPHPLASSLNSLTARTGKATYCICNGHSAPSTRTVIDMKRAITPVLLIPDPPNPPYTLLHHYGRQDHLLQDRIQQDHPSHPTQLGCCKTSYL